MNTYFYEDVVDYLKVILYLFAASLVLSVSISYEILAIKDSTLVDLRTTGSQVLFYALLASPLIHFGCLFPAFKVWRSRKTLSKLVSDNEGEQGEKAQLMSGVFGFARRQLDFIRMGLALSAALFLCFFFKFGEPEFGEVIGRVSVVSIPMFVVLLYIVHSIIIRMDKKEKRMRD